MKKLIVVLFAFMPALVQATDISQLPIDSLGTVKPNIIIGYDDSGSMANTYLPDSACSGSSPCNLTAQQTKSYNYNPLAYNPTKTYLPWIKTVKTSSVDAVRYPNASTSSLLSNPASISSGSIVPPDTYALTYTCSNNSNNTNYYKKIVIYPATSASNSTTSCPSSPVVVTLTSSYTAGQGQSWKSQTQVSSAIYYEVTATNAAQDSINYWNVVACPTGDLCSGIPAAINTGYKLKKITIAPTDTINLQNYANWLAYASQRKYMVSSAMSEILPSLTGITMGIQPFNSTSTTNNNTQAVDASVVTKTYNGATSGSNPGYYASSGRMFNLDYPADVNTLLDLIYNTESNSATPTHSNLNSIGTTFKNASLPLFLVDDTGANVSGRKGVIQYACQKNAAFVVTDGYANQSAYPAPPTYPQSTYGATVPYKTTTATSLADLGLAYYTINPRTDLAAGKVPADTYTTGGAADANTNLHMNTYALTLGVHGDLFGSTTYPTVTATANAYAIAPTWVNPTTATNNTKQIDDLWHATINGRGLMFSADNPDDLVTYVKSAFMDIVLRAGSQSAIAVANVNMTQTNNAAYGSSFNPQGWFGDVQKYSVNLSTGTVDNVHPVWSARDMLDAKVWGGRNIITIGNEVFGTTLKPTLPTGSASGASVATLIDYLRGDRSKEANGTNTNQYYRLRAHVLGDAINAEPVIANGMVYQATNDGMLHAFSESNGVEAWAYVPSQNIPNLGNLSMVTYNHQYFVDGTPIVATYAPTSNTSGSLLVGGLGAGRFGYYAVDVTTPTTPSAKWEFPKATKPADSVNGGKTSINKPRLIATKDSSHPYVVVISSGYNNGQGTIGGVVQSGGDGKGHIWFLDPATGETIVELTTPVGSSGAPLGLSAFAAFVADPIGDNTVSYLYGGDELGNVWKIDATSTDIHNWTIGKFAYVGKPVTVKPEISSSSLGKPIVLFGTGRLFGTTDLTNSDIQGFYAVQDLLVSGAAVIQRSDLTKLDATGSDAQDRTISMTGDCRDWNHQSSGTFDNKGWYFDFPQGGERVVGDPKIGLGHISFNTNLMSANSCSSASYAYWLSLNNSSTSTCSAPVDTGSNIGKYLGGYTASRPVLISLPNGKIEIVTHLGNGTILTTDTGLFSLVNTTIRSWRPLERPMR